MLIFIQLNCLSYTVLSSHLRLVERPTEVNRFPDSNESDFSILALVLQIAEGMQREMSH